MNAVLSLCHFCEYHGPRTLLCTQAINCNEKTLLLESTSSAIDEDCTSCRSFFDSHNCLISTDEETNMCYVTTQYPRNSQVFSIVRMACLRSLISERTQGREGPILFGDTESNVISYTFFLKDVQARGLERSCSIIMITKNRFLLMILWLFLIEKFKVIISEIKKKADDVYEAEAKECNPRARFMHSNMPRHRRSLIELTGDRDLTQRVHMWFTWILRACSFIIYENVFEGQPLEDDLYELERSEDDSDEKSMNYPDEDIVSSNALIETIRAVSAKLGHAKFRLLVYHLVVGNQIIVRCSEKSICRLVLSSLQLLLPRRCCKVIYFTDSYVYPFCANILGISVTCPIEESLLKTEEKYLLLDIIPRKKGELSLINCDFEIRTKYLAPIAIPKIASKIISLIYNHDIPANATLSCLTYLKENLIHKAKIFFSYTKQPNIDINEFYKALGIDESDTPALRFWQTGISNHYKSQMRQLMTE